jgi:hypothetical protein
MLTLLVVMASVQEILRRASRLMKYEVQEEASFRRRRLELAALLRCRAQGAVTMESKKSKEQQKCVCESRRNNKNKISEKQRTMN